jgi:predicted  nucleic acid-binding Zn-ribbon protein
MIELKTNPDTLHAMATEVMADRIKADVLNAAHDLKNLRDYAEGLERSTHQMSGEIQSIRTQRDEAAAALLAIIRPELQKMIEQELEDAVVVENLNDRFSDLDDRLERLEDPADTIRDEVRDMIRDGDITVTVDVM